MCGGATCMKSAAGCPMHLWQGYVILKILSEGGSQAGTGEGGRKGVGRA